jgi:hypothetical protein
MNTRALIDRIVPWCQGWSRSGGPKNLLKVVQIALDKLYDYDGDRYVYRGTDNQGYPPYLKTVAGQYRYDITAANLSCGPITKTIAGSTYTLVARKINRVFTALNTSRELIEIVPGTSQVGYENANTPPYFEFMTDPETYNDKFFIEFVTGAPRLLSENIPTPVPAIFESDIETFVIGYVQWRESGRPNDNVTYFENKVIPKFRDLMASGATIENNETQMRFC